MSLIKSIKKLDKRTLNVTLVEIFNALGLFLLLIGIGLLFGSLSQDLENLTPHIDKVHEFVKNHDGTSNAPIEENMEQGIFIMKTFMLKLTVGLIIALLLFVLFTTFTKGFIYSAYTKSDFRQFLRGFAKINIPWQLSWIVIIMLSFKIFHQLFAPFVVLLEIMLYFLLTPIYRSIYAKKKKHEGFLKAIVKKMKRAYMYLLPILLIFLLGFANFFIWVLIAIMPGLIFILLNAVFTLFLIVWARIYVLQVTEDMK